MITDPIFFYHCNEKGTEIKHQKEILNEEGETNTHPHAHTLATYTVHYQVVVYLTPIKVHQSENKYTVVTYRGH